MKVGILTLPLGSNIGGILQAYALQHFVSKMSHTTIIIDRKRVDARVEKGFLYQFKNLIRLVYHIMCCDFSFII